MRDYPRYSGLKCPIRVVRYLNFMFYSELGIKYQVIHTDEEFLIELDKEVFNTSVNMLTVFSIITKLLRRDYVINPMVVINDGKKKYSYLEYERMLNNK